MTRPEKHPLWVEQAEKDKAKRPKPPRKRIDILCPDCGKTRSVIKSMAKQRKSDTCRECYLKNPVPKPVVPKSRPGSKSQLLLDALDKVAAGVPILDVAEETGLTVASLRRASVQFESLKELAESVKDKQANQLYVLASILLESIDEVSIAQLTAKDRIAAAAKAIDTARMLEGKPTEIVAQYKLVIEKYFKVPVPATSVAEGSVPVSAADAAEGSTDAEFSEAPSEPEPGPDAGAVAANLLHEYGGRAGAGGAAGSSEQPRAASVDGSGQVPVRDPVWLTKPTGGVPERAADDSVAGEG